MADSGRPGDTAMKSVIAQLGERQQLISKNAVNDRPSTAAVKPLPAGKKPTGTGTPSSPRIPAKQPPSATKRTVSALQSPSPDSNKRLPVQSGMSQPAAALAGQTELLGASRLKPTIAAKPQVGGPSSTSTPSASESADEVSQVPPWQNLVRKKNVPPVPVKKTAPATSVTLTTASTPDVEFGVGSPAVDDSEQSQNLAKDPRSSVKVRSLKLAFEGASHDAAADVGQTNRTANSVSVAGTPKNLVATSTPASSKPVDSKPDSDQQGDRSLPARAAAGLGDSSPSPRRLSPRRQPVSVDNGSTTSYQEIVFSVDGRRYRRLPSPSEPTSRPARKPAKPPVVDLTPYRSFDAPSNVVSAAAADDDDDEIYDDAAAPLPTNDSQVTLRSSEPAGGGRQNATSVISQISEYTEEEEEMERRTLKKAAVSNRPAVCPPVSQSSDEVYDDVAAESADVAYYDDEIYQEID